MARELHRSGLPCVAASAVNTGQPVELNPGDTDWSVIPLATTGREPLGVALATSAAAEAVTVLDPQQVVKLTAAASLGAGAEVMIASSNGDLGPFVAAASGVIRWTVGKSFTAAAAGEKFSCLVRPRLATATV